MSPGPWRPFWTTQKGLISDHAKTEAKQNPGEGGRHRWKQRDEGKACSPQALMLESLFWWSGVVGEL